MDFIDQVSFSPLNRRYHDANHEILRTPKVKNT